MDVDTVILMAAQASRVENQDAIDTAIVGMLSDPKEVCSKYCFDIYDFKVGYSHSFMN